MSNEEEYGIGQLQHLEGLEGVRRRPGMYIGPTTEQGLHHLVWEIADNSIDEFLAGHATTVTIALLASGAIRVTDDGRGIPVDTDKKSGLSGVELVATKLHAGGKFGSGAYVVSGGLHGVGLSVVNALSIKTVITVHRGGAIWQQTFSRGKSQGPLAKIGKCGADEHGTAVEFVPDAEIFTTTVFNGDVIRTRMKERAQLNAGLRVVLELPDADAEEICYPEGIKSMIEERVSADRRLIEPIQFRGEVGGVRVDGAFLWTTGFATEIVAFANTVNNPSGGTHEQGFKTALSRVVGNWVRENAKTQFDVTGDDIREGVVACVHVLLPEPQFDGQTKHKLVSLEARPAVEQVLSQALDALAQASPEAVQVILDKVLVAARAREEAKKARDLARKKAKLNDTLALPEKLSDCSSKNPEERELLIVEGDSAGGSAKRAREKHFQAVLPLRGKILNTIRADLRKVLANESVKSLIAALGAGVDDEFKPEKCRYGKVIILTDADADGSHIRLLLLSLMSKHFPGLVQSGRVYAAQPPLYMIRKGKSRHWVYSDQERDKVLQGLTGKPDEVQRYKGLGEMDPDQLWETTLDPEHRILRRLSVPEDAEDTAWYDLILGLMGDEVEIRRRFLQEHAADMSEEIYHAAG